MSTPLVATVTSAELKHPPDSRDSIPAGKSDNKTAATKIRLVRWLSSYKQVFIAELLVRGTVKSK